MSFPMRVVADLHLHSKYARATSPSMCVRGLASGAIKKGLNLVATGDATHPKYFQELKSQLAESVFPGLFSFGEVLFMLESEISLIWSLGTGRTGVKRVHLIVYSPSLEESAQLIDVLSKKGNIESDGRPIFGMSVPEFTELLFGVSRNFVLVPAHAWTPWFSIFGSKSGFDSVEECFGDQAKHIFALETGLSSDPLMNWRVSALDKYALISNSDAHSPDNLGREANVFNFSDKELSFNSLWKSVKEKDASHFSCTYEFYPEEGKYHVDGHRACGISLSPRQALSIKNVCPVCRKPLTLGVLHRVEELADRPDGFVPNGAIPFKHLVPLREIVSQAVGKKVSSKQVVQECGRIISVFGSELAALEAPAESLSKLGERVSQGILRAREGKVKATPGYDGVYGVIDVFSEATKEDSFKNASVQKSLGDF